MHGEIKRSVRIFSPLSSNKYVRIVNHDCPFERRSLEIRRVKFKRRLNSPPSFSNLFPTSHSLSLFLSLCPRSVSTSTTQSAHYLLRPVHLSAFHPFSIPNDRHSLRVHGLYHPYATCIQHAVVAIKGGHARASLARLATCLPSVITCHSALPKPAGRPAGKIPPIAINHGELEKTVGSTTGQHVTFQRSFSFPFSPSFPRAVTS